MEINSRYFDQLQTSASGMCSLLAGCFPKDSTIQTSHTRKNTQKGRSISKPCSTDENYREDSEHMSRSSKYGPAQSNVWPWTLEPMWPGSSGGSCCLSKGTSNPDVTTKSGLHGYQTVTKSYFVMVAGSGSILVVFRTIRRSDRMSIL